MLIYADYACKMGSTSLAREDIFRTPIADKKTFIFVIAKSKRLVAFVDRKEQDHGTYVGRYFNLIASRYVPPRSIDKTCMWFLG